MKTVAAGRFVLLLVLMVPSPGESPVGAAPQAPADSRPGFDQRMIINERAVWESVKQKDAVRFRELVADDARIIFDTGILTKSDFVASLPERTIQDYTLDSFTVLRPNNRTTILIYRATRSGIYKGKAFPPAAVREASVWVLRKGKWVAVMNQETPIA